MSTDTTAPVTVQAAIRHDNWRMVGKLIVVVALMFAFGYALVPVYRTICTAIGINVLSLGETDVQGSSLLDYKKNTQIDMTRSITIEFDANAHGPWEFKPEKHSVVVHPGELTTVMYEFRNVQNRTMTAQAIPSYAPMQAMPYFNKIECFCFNQYTLKPGEGKRWPVVFVIDPKLSKDVKTITLSYTFFEVGGTVPPEPTGKAGFVDPSRDGAAAS
ncbi:MAG TPA: cytochrome c oxidase assembly protein [Burkholderiaceae bacterium]|jgi:cytochrome c oxidase assembly protein subunit 11